MDKPIGPKLGSKKLIRYGGKTGVQFCIDACLVSEVLKYIPRNVKVVQANVRLTNPLASRKIPVPNALKKLGVGYIREYPAAKEVSLVFDAVSKETILANTKKVAEHLGIDHKRAVMRAISLANSQASGYFIVTTKEIKPDETDLRKKLRVMGLSTGQGHIHSLLADLSASKYRCDFQEVIVKTAICRKE